LADAAIARLVWRHVGLDAPPRILPDWFPHQTPHPPDQVPDPLAQVPDPLPDQEPLSPETRQQRAGSPPVEATPRRAAANTPAAPAAAQSAARREVWGGDQRELRAAPGGAADVAPHRVRGGEHEPRALEGHLVADVRPPGAAAGTLDGREDAARQHWPEGEGGLSEGRGGDVPGHIPDASWALRRDDILTDDEADDAGDAELRTLKQRIAKCKEELRERERRAGQAGRREP